MPGQGFSGEPAFIQSRYGEKNGNFELLVPEADGNGFAEFWRLNDKPELPWVGPHRIDTIDGRSVGKVDSISLVQARNFGTPGLGNLNAIVRSGDTLKLFWQEDNGAYRWHGPINLPGSIG